MTVDLEERMSELYRQQQAISMLRHTIKQGFALLDHESKKQQNGIDLLHYDFHYDLRAAEDAVNRLAHHIEAQGEALNIEWRLLADPV